MRSVLLTILALSPVLPAPLSAQQQAQRHQVGLETPSLVGGTTATFRLRSTAIGQPARILVGSAAVQPLGLPHGVVLVDTTPGFLFQGTIGADGLFEVIAPLPSPLGIPNGFPVAIQGAVLLPQGNIVLSDRAVVIAEPQDDADFQDQSLALPASNTEASGEMIAVDLDRDGDRDLVLTGTSGLRFYINQAGTLVDDTANRLPAADQETAFTVLDGDFNKDGHPDLLVAGRLDILTQPMAAVIFLNDGSGFFSSSIGRIDLPLALEAHAFPVIGDVDADGDLDVLLTDGGYHSGGVSPQVMSLYRDQGGLQGGTAGDFLADATFGAAAFNVGPDAAAAADFGDVDNDGDLDLVVARANGGQNQLMLNDGTGLFTDATAQLPVFADKSSDIQLADLDADGYLDMIVMNSHFGIDPIQAGDVLYNRGAIAPGSFEDGGTRFPDTYDEDLIIRLFSFTADVDSDGDLDVLMLPHEFFGSATPFVGHPGLFVNQGGAQGGAVGVFLKDTGFFQAGGSTIETFVGSGAALFDLDGDGDLEIYVGSQGGIIDPLKTEDYLLGNVIL
ncbi:MAG: FG-GAP repeat domain-containing protein [Planctomycetota bacterium]|jgi:hypothetical protein